METTNVASLKLRDLDDYKKVESTLEEMRNSDDWEQGLVVISEDTFPYNLMPENRTYLVTKGSDYFNKNIEDGRLPGLNLTFTEFNPVIDLYIAGKFDITFKVETCYKLLETIDIVAVKQRIRDLTAVVITEDDDEIEEELVDEEEAVDEEEET